MWSQILHLRSNFNFRGLELLVLIQVSVGVSFIWRKFTAKQLSTNSPNGWSDFSEPVLTLLLFSFSCGTSSRIFYITGTFITDGISGYTLVAIALNPAIVISFDFVVVVVVELGLASSVGCTCCACAEPIVVRLSWDVLVDTHLCDACFILRPTLEGDGGGIAIASCVVSANTRSPRPPFVTE